MGIDWVTRVCGVKNKFATDSQIFTEGSQKICESAFAGKQVCGNKTIPLMKQHNPSSA